MFLDRLPGFMSAIGREAPFVTILMLTAHEMTAAAAAPEMVPDIIEMVIQIAKTLVEHIPDVEAAINSAVRMARSYVVVTVPSKEDDNPEHIHLLTKDKLTEYFRKAGVTKLSFDGVPGHLFMIAKVD